MVLLHIWVCLGASSSRSGTHISALSVAKYRGGSPPDTFCADVAGLDKMVTIWRVLIKQNHLTWFLFSQFCVAVDFLLGLHGSRAGRRFRLPKRQASYALICAPT